MYNKIQRDIQYPHVSGNSVIVNFQQLDRSAQDLSVKDDIIINIMLDEQANISTLVELRTGKESLQQPIQKIYPLEVRDIMDIGTQANRTRE